MNATARAKLDSIEHRRNVFRTALSHFGELDAATCEKVAAAVDDAYIDDLLFEEFEIWIDERNDKALLYQIDHFLNSKRTKTLAMSDLTRDVQAIEKIQKSAEKELAVIFAQHLRKLADRKKLKTNQALGRFLSKSAEQVRVMLSAAHKPQRKTLLLVAEKFGVTVESLLY